MPHTVKIAFLGCGRMGQTVHLRNFLKIPGCEIVAICDQRVELAKQVAAKHHIPMVFESLEEMLEKTDAEAVAAINHAHIHYAQVIQCAKAGKPIFVEKPMACSTEDCRAMLEALRANKVFCLVAHMKRYDNGIRLAKRLIAEFRESGELGKPVHARAHYFCGEWQAHYGEPLIEVAQANPSRTHLARHPGFVAPEMAGRWMGFLQQFGHCVDTLRYLWGDPDSILFARWRDFRADSQSCDALLRIGDFTCGFEADRMAAHFWDEEYKLYFQKGWVEVKSPPPLVQQTPAKVEVYRSDRPAFERPIADWGWAFENEARDFVDCVREGRQPVATAEDIWKTVYICEEMLRPNEAGRGLDLRYD